MDINNKLKKIIDFENYPIHQASFISKCRDKINNEGCVVLPDFLNHETINQLISESKKNQEKAYYCRQEHSVFIMPHDDNFPPDHPRNRLVVSSKGCITDDQISYNSSLKILYKSDLFRDFIAHVVGEKKLYAVSYTHLTLPTICSV